MSTLSTKRRAGVIQTAGFSRRSNAERSARTALGKPGATNGVDFLVEKDNSGTYSWRALTAELPPVTLEAVAAPSTKRKRRMARDSAEISATKTKNTLTFTQRLAIHDKVKEVCHTRDGVYAIYADGHSDQTVAASMNFDCTVHNVAGIRREIFGQLPPASFDAEASKADRLERLVHALCTRLGVSPEELLAE